MGRLTTHVLDTARGRPAAGVRVELFRLEGERRERLTSAVTNADGRCDAPLLQGADLKPGQYELLFHAGDYLAAAGAAQPSPRFLDIVPIRFGVADPDGNYHVPLVASPFGYSTYRGS